MKLWFKLSLFAIIFVSAIICKGQIVNYQPNIDSVYSKILKDAILVTGWYYVNDNKIGFERQLDKSSEMYFIDPKPIVVKANFLKTEIYKTDFKGAFPDYVGLTIQLDKEGTKNWSVATGNAIYKRLALIINDRLVNVPNVNAQITNGITALNRAEYSEAEIEAFKKQIDD